MDHYILVIILFFYKDKKNQSANHAWREGLRDGDRQLSLLVLIVCFLCWAHANYDN